MGAHRPLPAGRRGVLKRLVAGLLLASGAACGDRVVTVPTVGGVVTARQGVAFPPGASLVVSLADVTDADPVVLAQDSLTGLPPLPIPFELRYDSTRIDPTRRYAVAARVVVNGDIVFASVVSQDVLTAGRGTRVELPVEPASIMGPLPRRAADVVVLLPAMERVDGSWRDREAASTISVYLQDGALRYIEERMTIGAAGSAANAYFFAQGALFYHETIKRLGAAAPGGPRDEVAFRVLFREDGSIEASARWINGEPVPFDSAELRSALRHAAAIREAALRLAAQDP